MNLLVTKPYFKVPEEIWAYKPLKISLRETNWPLSPINKLQRKLLVTKPYFKVPEENLGI